MVRSVNDYFVGCICALEVELAAFQACMDEIHEQIPVPPGDDNAYTFGRVGNHSVVVGCLGITGKVSVAAVAKDMSRTFPSMKFALMIGIGGGIWSEQVDVRLGDVVVGAAGPSPGVIQYDYGKTIQGRGLVQKGSLQKPPAMLLNAVTALKAKHRLGQYGFASQLEQLSKHESDYIISIATRPDQDTDRLFQSDYVHSQGDTCSGCDNGRTTDRGVRKTQIPQVHYGVIASGDQVMKDAEMRDQIMLRHGVICFEMEAAGLMDTFPSLAIRGISDYSDSHKNDAWQPYAATVAAAYAKDLLTMVSPVQVKELSSAGEVFESVTFVPFSRDVKFIGRNELLQAVHNAFAKGAARVALHGLGGVGKTQIAVEYAYRYRQERPIAPIIWIHASGAERFVESCAAIARRLKLPGDQRDTTAILSDWLSDGRSDWLLIIDNADDVNFVDGSADDSSSSGSNRFSITDFITRLNNGRILITSRNLVAADKLVGDPDSLIEVCPMSIGEAVDLLQSKLSTDTKGEILLQDLAEELDRIPLAIIQAAAYMRQNRKVTLTQYLRNFRSSQTDRKTLLEFHNPDPRRDCKASNAILATWKISFEAIKTDCPASAALLSVLSMFDRQGIPDYLISSKTLYDCDFEHLNELSDLQLSKAVSVLISFSFINMGPSGDTYDMHRLIQFATQSWLYCESMYESSRSAAMSILVNIYPSDYFDGYEICTELEPHAGALSRNRKDTFLLSFQETELLHHRAEYNEFIEQRSKAAEMNGKVMLSWKRLFGVCHARTIEAIKLQCSIMEGTGEYTKIILMAREVLGSYLSGLSSANGDTEVEASDRAEGMMEILIHLVRAHQELGQLDEALRTLEEAGRATKVDTMTRYSKMRLLHVSVLRDLGRFEEAQTLKTKLIGHVQALVDVKKKTVGPYHEETLEAMKELGGLYKDLDEFLPAKAVFTEIIEALTYCTQDEQQWQYKIDILDELAGVHVCLKEMQQAESLRVEVVERYRHGYGLTHPWTIFCMHGLAACYHDTHNYVQEKALLLKLWHVEKSTVTLENIEVTDTLARLAQVEECLGDLAAADSMWNDLVTFLVALKGPRDGETLVAMSRRALNLGKRGRLNEACESWTRILTLTTEGLGINHEMTAITLADLALCKERLGELREAESLWNRLVDIRTRSFGIRDEKTLDVMDLRAYNLKKQGRFDEACKSWSKILTLATECLGINHEMTATALDGLAMCKEELGKLREAESLWDQSVDIRIDVFGLRNEKTLPVMNCRAYNLKKQGRFDEACKSWSELLALATDALGTEHWLTKDVQDSLDTYRIIVNSSDEEFEEDSEEDWVTDSDKDYAGDATQAQHAGSSVQETTFVPVAQELRLRFPTTLHRTHLVSAMTITSSPLQCLRSRKTIRPRREGDETPTRKSSLDLSAVD